MSRQPIVTNARAVQSADAFVCTIVRMTLGLDGFEFSANRWRSPGEGDAASP